MSTQMRMRFAKVNVAAVVVIVLLLAAAGGIWYWNSTSESREVDEWKKSGENLQPLPAPKKTPEKGGIQVQTDG